MESKYETKMMNMKRSFEIIRDPQYSKGTKEEKAQAIFNIANRCIPQNLRVSKAELVEAIFYLCKEGFGITEEKEVK